MSIGGGPAGCSAAIRAAQLGLKAAIVEQGAVGGTCLNWGCIPTKTLLYAAEIYGLSKKMAELGTVIGEGRLEFSRIKRRQERIVKQLQLGLSAILTSYGIPVIKGKGRLGGQGQVLVDTGSSQDTISAKHILIATGSAPASLPSLPIDGQRVLNSGHVLSVDILPAELHIVGAGAVGVEFATFFQTLGLPVTLQEKEPRLLPGEDEDISQELENQFARMGMTIKTKDSSLPPEKKMVLVATGRKPVLENLGLERAGVAMDKGRIVTDQTMKTSVAGIYAAGDVVAKTMFAYGAAQEGIVAAEQAAGHKSSTIDYRFIPRCIFCHPQVASVGLTEAQAKAQGGILVGKFSLAANPRATILSQRHGLIKVVADAKTHTLLGIHMIGHEVTEHIGGAALALKLGAKLEDFSREIFPHPTLAEALYGACEDALGRCVDLPKKI